MSKRERQKYAEVMLLYNQIISNPPRSRAATEALNTLLQQSRLWRMDAQNRQRKQSQPPAASR